MTYEEALNFNQKWNETQAFNDLERYLLREEKPAMKAVAIAMKALEKQIPKKPIYEADGYDDNGNLIYDIAFCPNCDNKFEVGIDDDIKYCPECGQAIDWSDD